MRQQGIRRSQPFHQHLDRAPGALAAVQACRNDAGVVQYQQVTGLEQTLDIGELQVCPLPRGTFEAQQTATGTLRRRPLGDELFGQVVAEILATQVGHGAVGGPTCTRILRFIGPPSLAGSTASSEIDLRPRRTSNFTTSPGA